MAMKRFSKLKMPKMGKRPMMMGITALVIVFLFYFFFMRGGRSMSEGFREGAGAAQASETRGVKKAAKAAVKAIASGQSVDLTNKPKVAAEVKKMQETSAPKKGANKGKKPTG
jgi:hypothetical protein